MSHWLAREVRSFDHSFRCLGHSPRVSAQRRKARFLKSPSTSIVFALAQSNSIGATLKAHICILTM